MSVDTELQKRSNDACELCQSNNNLVVYQVPPKLIKNVEHCALICAVCLEQINDTVKTDANHWRCLNDSMWSEVSAVKVIAWRMLNRLKGEGWPQDLLDMIYLDDETLNWAKSGLDEVKEVVAKHKDSNGVELQAGDTVVLIKDLDVKGANFTAKRGTAVRNIKLVHDNPEHIEGRVEGQSIVILTQFVKKS